MAKYVALVRAVNVPGHARVATAELAKLFAAAGAHGVASLGHAGSFLFEAASATAVAKAVAASVRDRYGEPPVIVLRTAAELIELTAARPFAASRAASNAKLYVAFLARKPRVVPALPLVSAAERLSALACRGRDVLVVSEPKPNGFYGFPNAFVETAFGATATTRNWSTVTRLAELLAS